MNNELRYKLLCCDKSLIFKDAIRYLKINLELCKGHMVLDYLQEPSLSG